MRKLEKARMEVRIGRDVFLTGVQKVQGIVETKGAMPILSHLLIRTENGGLFIEATDLEIGTQAFYPANIVSQGSVTLNARKLYDILRELPDMEVHMIKEDNDWVTLKCGNSKFRLPGLPTADFPSLPEYSSESLMEFSCLLLKEMIRKTFFAASPDETRQALNGLLLEIENGQANLVGTDGHRLALITRPLLKSTLPKNEKTSYLLPRKALSELLKLMEDEESTFSFSEKGNHLAFIQGKQVIISRKIDGKFPNYRQVIPPDNNLKVTINRDELNHALKRVALLANEKSKMVRFDIQKGTLTLVSDNSDLGTAREEITIAYEGEDVAVGLNAKYVLDVLNVIEDAEIVLNLKDQNHSCLISIENDKDYLSIVMPMRI
jgi:DNA polymerase III subunit beta